MHDFIAGAATAASWSHSRGLGYSHEFHCASSSCLYHAVHCFDAVSSFLQGSCHALLSGHAILSQYGSPSGQNDRASIFRPEGEPAHVVCMLSCAVQIAIHLLLLAHKASSGISQKAFPKHTLMCRVQYHHSQHSLSVSRGSRGQVQAHHRVQLPWHCAAADPGRLWGPACSDTSWEPCLCPGPCGSSAAA